MNRPLLGSPRRRNAFCNALPLPILTASPAVAEVCDKLAGDAWSPDQGPINPSATGLTIGWLIVAMIAVAVVLCVRSRKLAWIAACLAALCCVLVSRLGDDEMTRAAIAEGCWRDVSPAGAWVPVFVLVILTVFLVRIACARTAIR